jgi:hypothetical protein
MVDVQGTKFLLKKSQVALLVASIVCGVLSLLLFIVVLMLLFGINIFKDFEAETSNPIVWIVIGGSLELIAFAINFVILDYALRYRIKELSALEEDDSADLVTRFAGKINAHGIVLLVFAWLGVIQAVYAIGIYIALPSETSLWNVGIEWELLGLLVGLVPTLVHFKLAKTLRYESKILLAQLN